MSEATNKSTDFPKMLIQYLVDMTRGQLTSLQVTKDLSLPNLCMSHVERLHCNKCIGVNCPSFGRTVLLLDALSFCHSFGY